MIKDMKKTMKENLLFRYTIDEQKYMLGITSVVDPRFKNKHYNTSSTVRETLVLEAYYEATKQPNIDEDDSQTQLPEESQSQVLTIPIIFAPHTLPQNGLYILFPIPHILHAPSSGYSSSYLPLLVS